MIRRSKILFAVIVFITCLSGCGKNNDVVLDRTAFITDITELSVGENVQIVGMGEASHGTSEFQQLKGDVFKALVANNECRVFAIEGDFGGCMKVNKYIHGGEGTAQEAIAQIGFRIYRTQEMADLVEWMRTYNETAPEGKDLMFYGFDAQRYDNNKEFLFEYLKENMPELAQAYTTKLVSLTDEAMYSLEKSVLTQAEDDISALMLEIQEQKPSDMDASVLLEYELALEYAHCLLENTQLRSESTGYSKMRDALMAKKVEWIVQHVNSMIYINGHNGHIGKQSVSGYTCMGQLLDEKYGDKYFAVGTDAANTQFNAQDGEIYKVFDVENQNAFTSQLNEMDKNLYYLEFAKVSQDESWQKILEEQQRMTALNVGFSNMQKAVKMYYTLMVTPARAYDGIIVMKNTEPTHLLP